jgi:hypothetical protein
LLLGLEPLRLDARTLRLLSLPRLSRRFLGCGPRPLPFGLLLRLDLTLTLGRRLLERLDLLELAPEHDCRQAVSQGTRIDLAHWGCQ